MSSCVPEIVKVSLVRGNNILPRLDDIPIPPRVRIDEARWPSLLVEIADHIGAYAALKIVDAYPGCYIYVPMDHALSPFTRLIGEELARVISHVFGRERLPIPLRGVVTHVRRCQLAYLYRAGKITLQVASAVGEMHVRHMCRLAKLDENWDQYDEIDLPEPRDVQLLRAATEIAESVMRDHELPGRAVCDVRDRIMALHNALDLQQSDDSEGAGPDDDLSVPVGA